MKIRFTAKSEEADRLYRCYLDKPMREIKTIRVLQENPLVVEVEPRMSFMMRKALNILLSKEDTKRSVIGEWTNRYATMMSKEGLRPSDYDIEVIVYG